MSPPALAGLAALGVIAGIAAWRIADAVLGARDDAPSPGPSWAPAAAAVVGAALFPVAGSVADDPWLVPALLGFGLLTLTLTITDLRSRLIPDRINLPGSAGCVVLLAAAALAAGRTSSLGRAGAGALILTGFYTLLFVAGRGSAFGFGDVKLAPVLGLFTAFVGWDAFWVGLFTGIMVGGLVAVVLVVGRLRRARDHFAFGPSLMTGAWLGLIFGERIVDWYLG
ncbi:MAG: prepilin peptidase [Acidimicrobiia bacterium]